MDSLLALSCPKCSGRLEIQEGARIVICPFCQTRSILRGERGMFCYQVPLKRTRDEALQTVRKFLSDVNGVFGLSRQSVITESVLVYLPVWSVSTTAMGWAFGMRTRINFDLEVSKFPAEANLVERMSWILAGSDATEFGLYEIGLEGRPLEPFEPEAGHESGMVFEPAIAEAEARRWAEASSERRVKKKAKLDRTTMLWIRHVRERVSLVYYPMWVVRIAFRGRAYQVVVDGFSGKVRYGTAPGKPVLYRAAALVLGMALGALLLLFSIAALSAISDIAVRAAAAGASGLMGVELLIQGYIEYRYGAEVQYGTHRLASQPMFWPPESLKNLMPHRGRAWEEKVD